MDAQELEHRRALGIPDDAERVLLLMESSHWDVNWLLTSQEYRRFRVAGIIDKVLAALVDDPARVWNLEALWFLREYLQHRPERTDELRQLLQQRRVRVAGFAWTTPDTLLPHPESLLRDYADGQQWLLDLGVDVTPDVAYLPDSFGHTPALPSLLTALSIRGIALTRVDGMFFPGATYEPRSAFPIPGSTAAALTEAGSADVVWRDRSGAELLTHWNAFTYGHGDLLAARGVSRWMGLPTSVPDRSEAHVARRIRQYVADLTPLARTPYLLLCSGFDFVDPIPDLGGLLRRWNDQQYPTEGVWALTAGLDDYLGLVDHHRADLPVLPLDPNPYWTGFFASRPGIKGRVHQLVRGLLEREARALAAEGPAGLARTAHDLRDAWRVAIASNHHDFVTGTAPDRVVAAEQEPWLQAALRSLAAGASGDDGAGANGGGVGQPGSAVADAHPAGTPHDRLGASADATMGRARPDWHMELLCIRDGGGLWRMGHEFPGGRFDERIRVRVPGHGRIGGHPVSADLAELEDGLLRLDTSAAAAPGTTLLLRIPLTEPTDTIRTGVTGGWIDRPAHREQTPTFWCVNDWASVPGLTVALDRPTAVAVEPGGAAILVVVGRNATWERARGIVPFPAFPVGGHDASPMTLAALLAPWRVVAEPAEVEPLRRLLGGPLWPVSVQRDGADTGAATVCAVHMGRAGVHVRIQVHEPGPLTVVAEWPGAAGGTWQHVDARGSALGLPVAGETVAWHVERAGWATLCWQEQPSLLATRR